MLIMGEDELSVSLLSMLSAVLPDWKLIDREERLRGAGVKLREKSCQWKR